MATEYLTNDIELTSVADAIREKGGTSASLTYPDGFSSAIRAIQTRKPEQSKTVNIASNGTNIVNPDSGYVLSSVTINTNVSSSSIGEYIGSYVLSDGILKFNVPQEDYSNYRNYYIKKSSVPFGLFLNNLATGTMSDTWRVTHETSSAELNFSADYVSVSYNVPFYYFTINLADSGANYYEGGVEVYVLTV